MSEYYLLTQVNSVQNNLTILGLFDTLEFAQKSASDLLDGVELTWYPVTDGFWISRNPELFVALIDPRHLYPHLAITRMALNRMLRDDRKGVE
jgi:hypothetical protein